MLRLSLLTILTILHYTKSFVIEPQEEVINNYYKTARALLTPEQEEFLKELLAADEAILEATSRGIVDDILQTLAGSGNIRVNIVGGTPQQQQQAANLVTSISPALQVVSGSLQGQPVAPSAEKTLLSTATTGAQSTAPAVTASILPLPGISLGGLTPSSNAQTTGTGGGNVTVVGGNNNHLLSTISSVIMNSGRRNVTGIVDESLRIATPAPIREFVTGILGVVYCNSIRRLLGRC